VKRFLKTAAFTALFAVSAVWSCFSISAAENAAFSLRVNGKIYQIAADAQPINVDGRTLIPPSELAAAFSGSFNQGAALSGGSVTLTAGGTVIEFAVDKTSAKVNGIETALDTPPVTRDGRVYLPFRFTAENLGYTVSWNADSRVAGAMDQATYEAIATLKRAGNFSSPRVAVSLTLEGGAKIERPNGAVSCKAEDVQMLAEYDADKNFYHIKESGRVSINFGSLVEGVRADLEMYADNEYVYGRDGTQMTGARWAKVEAQPGAAPTLQGFGLGIFSDPEFAEAMSAYSRELYAAALVTEEDGGTVLTVESPMSEADMRLALGLVLPAFGREADFISNGLERALALFDISWLEPLTIREVIGAGDVNNVTIEGRAAAYGVGEAEGYGADASFVCSIEFSYAPEFTAAVPDSVKAEAVSLGGIITE
jgi:hypothetical protein